MAYSNPLSQYPSLEKQPVLEQYRVALSSYLFLQVTVSISYFTLQIGTEKASAELPLLFGTALLSFPINVFLPRLHSSREKQLTDS